LLARIFLTLALFAAMAMAAASALTRLSDAGRLSARFALLHPSEAALKANGDAACISAQPCPIAEAQRFAAHIAHKAPASAAGLVYLAAAAAATQDPRATAFAAAALNRDPRSPVGLGVMADAARVAGDPTAQLARLEQLAAIYKNGNESVFDALARVAETPEGLKLLEARLRQKPDWAQQVLSRLAGLGVDPLTLLRMSEADQRQQDQVIRRVFLERGPAAAYLAWLAILPADAALTMRWPFDASFENKAAPPPFGWALKNGEAEFHRGGGVFASYSGRGRAAMAEQVMLLGPGRYRFSAEASGELGRNGGGLAWSIQCLGKDGPILGSVTMADLSDTTKTYSFDFVTPPRGCQGQVLRLQGVPGEFPLRARTLTQSVAIAALDKAPSP
jgi:hypothetical protein